MRFALDPEQREFAASLHALLAGADVPTLARRWAAGDTEPGRALWKRLAELGVSALAVPKSAGGLGAHPVDLVLAVEELGHHAVPGPVVESIAAVPTLLAGLGQRPESSEWLPALADGEMIATLVAPPHLPLAPDADVAGVVLAVDAEAIGVVEALDGDPELSVDTTRRLFRPGQVRSLSTDPGGAVTRAFDTGVLACAAQLLGLGCALLEAAVTHARHREQFGQPIGSFQAVAHRLADVHVSLELARPLLYGAAVALAAGSATTARDVSAAKVAAGHAAHRAGRAALQVHGAVGYTEEHSLGLSLTKARALLAAWGTPAVHRARVRRAL